MAAAALAPREFLLFLLVLLATIIFPATDAACGSCLGSLALAGAGGSSVQGHRHHPANPAGRAVDLAAGGAAAGANGASRSALFGYLAARHLLQSRFFASAEDASAEEDSPHKDAPNDREAGDKAKGSLEDLLTDEDAYETAEQRGADPEYLARQEKGVTSAGMTGAIGFYKGWISPLLPPACRFVPTCSQYGVQAIQEFGPGRGAILTAWRLARCSPFGGKGYDPPRWPPVPYWYSSY